MCRSISVNPKPMVLDFGRGADGVVEAGKQGLRFPKDSRTRYWYLVAMRACGLARSSGDPFFG
jgi:hypothetical protein